MIDIETGVLSNCACLFRSAIIKTRVKRADQAFWPENWPIRNTICPWSILCFGIFDMWKSFGRTCLWRILGKGCEVKWWKLTKQPHF